MSIFPARARSRACAGAGWSLCCRKERSPGDVDPSFVQLIDHTGGEAPSSGTMSRISGNRGRTAASENQTPAKRADARRKGQAPAREGGDREGRQPRGRGGRPPRKRPDARPRGRGETPARAEGVKRPPARKGSERGGQNGRGGCPRRSDASREGRTASREGRTASREGRTASREGRTASREGRTASRGGRAERPTPEDQNGTVRTGAGRGGVRLPPGRRGWGRSAG
jgi:hypothetical protein